MDGFGINPGAKGNAIEAANTPNLTRLFKENPFTTIGASGLDVGLPNGQMGNSEVGHTNIGAGRVVYQMLVKISKDIEDGVFFENEPLKNAMKNCREKGTALHLIGLLSDGGVHSHIDHLYGLLEMAKREGLEKVYIHCIMDGRDVSVTSGVGFVRDVCEKTAQLGVGKIATIEGRYYAMDRDFAWDRVEKAYAAMVYGEGIQNTDPVDAMEKSYAGDVTDEFIVPTVVDGEGTVKADDSVVFFNFRPDRARQITRTFVDADFDGFERRNGFFPLTYVCMTQYDETMPNVTVAYPPEELKMTMGEYLAVNNMTQLRIAETQKYAHVTFFFNGGTDEISAGEEHIILPSPKVETYDLAPEMRAYDLAEIAVNAVRSHKFDLLVMNFANPDMVGHTAVRPAVISAVHAVDECVGRVVAEIVKEGGRCLVTADHGNCETMAENGKPMTAHTTNPVPLIYVAEDAESVSLKEGGRLGNIAPTLLEMMGLEKPEAMTEESLIVR